MNCKASGYNHAFSHIYVERGVRDHARTKQILSRFPEAQIIEITHYKDVFNRRGQQYEAQHRSQSLILAAKKESIFSTRGRSLVRISAMIISFIVRR